MFIVIEGPDGIGKTTIQKRLKEWFETYGASVVATREPGGTEAAEEIRALFGKTKFSTAKAEIAVMFAARFENVHDIIEPALADGKVVICDRYVMSTRVYNVKTYNDDSVVDALSSYVPHPDIALVLVPSDTDVITDRLAAREVDITDPDAKRLQEIVNRYHDIAWHYHEIHVDKDDTIDDVLTMVMARVITGVGLKKFVKAFPDRESAIGALAEALIMARNFALRSLYSIASMADDSETITTEDVMGLDAVSNDVMCQILGMKCDICPVREIDGVECINNGSNIEKMHRALETGDVASAVWFLSGHLRTIEEIDAKHCHDAAEAMINRELGDTTASSPTDELEDIMKQAKEQAREWAVKWGDLDPVRVSDDD